MSDLFIEVDEAMKQERLEKLWKEYGGIFLSFLAMIILVTAANAGYKAWTQHRNFKQTNLYLETVTKPDTTTDDLLALLPEISTTGMKDLVRMRAAGLAIENNDTEKALEIYTTIQNDTEEHDQLFQDLAQYMATNLDQKLSTEEKIKRFESIGTDKNNPWAYSALLDAAILEATQNKDFAKARTHLAKILSSDNNPPQGLQQKAQSLEILYQAQQSEKP